MKSTRTLIVLALVFGTTRAEDSLGIRTLSMWPYSNYSLLIKASDSLAILGLCGGFWVVDFTDPTNPSRVGECIAGGYIRDAQVKGGLLYASDAERGFRVFDVGALPEVSEVCAVGDQSYNRICVADTLAFLSRAVSVTRPYNPDTIDVYNLAEPRLPVKAGSFSVGPATYAGRMAAQANRLYIACESEGLRVYDVSDPVTPRFVGSWQHPEGWEVSVLAVRDTVACVAGWDTLRVLNVSDPGRIAELGKVRLAVGKDERNIQACILSDTLLYAKVAWDSGSCVVVSVANPKSPIVVGRTGESGGNIGLEVAGQLVITGEFRGAAFYDVTDPCSPRILGWVPLPSLATHVRARDSVAFLALSRDGFLAIDVSEPPVARPRGQYPPVFPRTYPRAGYTIPALRDSLVFTGFLDTNFLYVLNAANPDSLSCIGSCCVGPRPHTAVRAVFLKDSLAFVACANGRGVAICDISDPANPVLLSRTEIPGSSADCYNVVAQANFAYAACAGEGLWVLDITDLVHPALRGHLPVPSGSASMLDIAVRDTLAYVACSYGGVWVVNVKNPDRPWVALHISPSMGQQALNLWVEQNLLYVANGHAGLRVYDISDVGSPVEVGYYRPYGPVNGVHVHKGLIHVAEYIGGYRCLQYYGSGVQEGQGEGKDDFRSSPTVGTRFSIPASRGTGVEVYDSQGRLVTVLPAGQETLTLGSRPTGVHFLVPAGQKSGPVQKIIFTR